MEVNEEHKEHVKLEPTSGDVHSKGDDDDDQKPFLSFLEFPITQIKIETVEVKEERNELNEIETIGSEESLTELGKGPTDHSPLNLQLLKGTMGLVKEEAEEMYEEGSSGALSVLSDSEIKCQLGTCEIKEEIMETHEMESKGSVDPLSQDVKAVTDHCLLNLEFLKGNAFDKATILLKNNDQEDSLTHEKKEENQDSQSHIAGGTGCGDSNLLIEERKSHTDHNSHFQRFGTKYLVNNNGVDQQNIDTISNVFHCEKRDLSFVNRLDLSEHKLIHEKGNPLTCEECSKSSLLSTNTYTNDRPFICEYCTKSFSDSTHLKLHMRTHTGERPFVCNLCSKSFSDGVGLKKHIRTHTGERPFVCNICNKSFSDSSNLNRHFRTHTGERPFVCNICNKSFIRKSGLTAHMCTHTGQRPFVCKHCSKSYSQSNKLNKHMRSHGDEHPIVSMQNT